MNSVQNEREKLRKKMKNLTKKEKQSSLEAPFWDLIEKVDIITTFMQDLNKLWCEIEKESKSKLTSK